MCDSVSAVVDQPAKEMPGMNDVLLSMTGLHLYASGVFSNVYRGTLVFQNGTREIAIKKTWPETTEKNFETIFLTGINREKHKNILSMLYAFSNRAKDGRICESFVTEFMPETLHSVTRQYLLDAMDVKLYAFQLFNGLKYLATDLIIHRDIKPVNVLVDHANGLLKISDFGSAKILKPGYPSSAYQVTRFYRAPELLLGSQFYDCAVDVWSAGCVLGEMVRRHILFPGRDNKHQLKLVVKCFGMPEESDYEAMRCLPERVPPEFAPGSNEKTHRFGLRLTGRKSKETNGLAGLISEGWKEVIEIVERILTYNPQKRLCGAEMLRNPFFDTLFITGAQRSNGQLIADIITPLDRAMACADVPRARRSKLANLMDRGTDMNFNVQNTKARATSKEKLPQVVVNASYESLLRMRKSCETVGTVKTLRSSLQPVARRKSSDERTNNKSVMQHSGTGKTRMSDQERSVHQVGGIRAPKMGHTHEERSRSQQF